MQTGKNQQTIKEMNRALVLRLICTGREISRIDIARLTGLTKMTVTNIAGRLISEGLVREGQTAENEGNVGRRPIMLLPREDSLYAAGAYISRDAIVASRLSLSARILEAKTVPLSAGDDAQSLLKKLLGAIEAVCAAVPKSKIAGIGVACIGPLDLNRGVILSPPDFYGIRDVPVRSFVEEKTGAEVILNNDMKASAMAERLYGRGRGLQNFIYVGVTNGIGSGIFVDGKLFRGEMGHSGEIGHTSLNYKGPLCSCGNQGCLELYASIPNVLKKAREQSRLVPSVLREIADFTFADIAENARKDRLCGEIIGQMAEALGAALVNEVNTLDLSTVILGHEAAFAGEYFAGLLEDYINRRILFKNTKKVKVEIAELGSQCPIVGSGVLVLNQLFGEMT